MKQVNLQEIAIQNMPSYEITERVIFAMEQACKQAIDLCVQASIEYADNEDVKQSLLNVKTKIV